jgi:hypothetical protein
MMQGEDIGCAVLLGKQLRYTNIREGKARWGIAWLGLFHPVERKLEPVRPEMTFGYGLAIEPDGWAPVTRMDLDRIDVSRSLSPGSAPQ